MLYCDWPIQTMLANDFEPWPYHLLFRSLVAQNFDAGLRVPNGDGRRTEQGEKHVIAVRYDALHLLAGHVGAPVRTFPAGRNPARQLLGPSERKIHPIRSLKSPSSNQSR